MLESLRIKELALEAGFDLCGITRAQHLGRNEEVFRRWLERGFDASLSYMRNHLDVRFDTRRLVEGARTVVVCAVSYRSHVSEGYDTACRTRIASYACNRDYHKTIRKMLQHVLRTLQQENPALAGRIFVDSAPLLEKQYAVEAGLGWIGRQSLLITPRFGSFVLLGEMVLCDEADSYDTPYTHNGCGACRRCLDACPTGAIVAPMTIDAARCVSCHTIEAEPDSTIDLHGWIFGCDECQSCCPYNRHAPMHRNTAFDPLFDPASIDSAQWAAMDGATFNERFGTTPLKRSGLERLRRNAARNAVMKVGGQSDDKNNTPSTSQTIYDKE